jgi:hypothetical protein
MIIEYHLLDDRIRYMKELDSEEGSPAEVIYVYICMHIYICIYIYLYASIYVYEGIG